MNNDVNDKKQQLIDAAETVSHIKDEALRRQAFEAFLNKILGSSSMNENTNKRPRSVSGRRANRTTSAIKRNSPVEVKKSQIRLGVDQLRNLRAFYDQHTPQGQEEAVFTIAYFLHETLKLKRFHEDDINILYNNLLSAKPQTHPPAMDREKIKRALRWLVAPSRRRQWLTHEDGMYEITPSGVLHMTYGSEK